MGRNIILTNKSKLGSLVCQRLLESNHSQIELARYCGITPVSLSNILRGVYSPCVKTIKRISEFTNIDVSTLVELALLDKEGNK